MFLFLLPVLFSETNFFRYLYQYHPKKGSNPGTVTKPVPYETFLSAYKDINKIFRSEVDIWVQLYIYIFVYLIDQKCVLKSPISLANLSKIFVNDTFCKQLAMMTPKHKHCFRTTGTIQKGAKLPGSGCHTLSRYKSVLGSGALEKTFLMQVAMFHGVASHWPRFGMVANHHGHYSTYQVHFIHLLLVKLLVKHESLMMRLILKLSYILG